MSRDGRVRNAIAVASKGTAACTFSVVCAGAVWLLVYLLFILVPLFRASGGLASAVARFLDRALGRFRLFRPCDDGSAVRSHRALPLRLPSRGAKTLSIIFHRQISLVAVGLVVAHPIILVAVQPQLLAPSNMLEAPLTAHFALVSIASVIALGRRPFGACPLKISYEKWHLIHVVLAVVAIIAGVVHMVWVELLPG